MSLVFTLILLGGCAILLYAINTPRRQARNATWQTDDHLKKGESALLTARLDEAAMHFQQAKSLAARGYAPIFRAEACYGLARVAERRGDLEASAAYLEEALSHEAEFKAEFPNYADLLRHHLSEVEASLGR